MTPVVNRLEADYGEHVSFAYLNAQTDGEAAFLELGLPGHPMTLIFNRSGQEVYRGFGVVTDDDLRSAIEDLLPREG